MPRVTDLTTAVDEGESSELVFVIVCESGTFFAPLDPSRAMVFGRGEDCDVTVEDTSVSRKHAAIGGTPLRAEDLGSRNGTRLLGVRLEPGKPRGLPVGASIELGRAIVLVQRGTFASAAAKALPAWFVAEDARTLRVVRLAEVVATRPGHVLVVGEPGSGKETLARFVHDRSSARAGPFVRLGRAEADTELNAAITRAQGGTLFVEALDQLSEETQRTLVRSVEAASPRVISSAGPDAAKTMPADVLRGLAGVILGLPPLRERIADIEPLARAFVRGAALRAGRPPPELTRGAIARLVGHTWPTNVRGLASAIEAAVLASNRVVDEDALGPLGVGPASVGLHDAVDELERRRVLDALADAGGNQSVAARKLGIARGTLIARLTAYGVARPRKKK